MHMGYHGLHHWMCLESGSHMQRAQEKLQDGLHAAPLLSLLVGEYERAEVADRICAYIWRGGTCLMLLYVTWEAPSV